MSNYNPETGNTLIEHWTDSRRVLVLDGTPDVIDEIAKTLAIPSTRLIMLTPNRAVLGLWEESLLMYIGGTNLRQTNGNGYNRSDHASHYLTAKRCNQVRYNRKSKS